MVVDSYVTCRVAGEDMSQGFCLKTLKIFQVCTDYVYSGCAGYMLVDNLIRPDMHTICRTPQV